MDIIHIFGDLVSPNIINAYDMIPYIVSRNNRIIDLFIFSVNQFIGPCTI